MLEAPASLPAIAANLKLGGMRSQAPDWEQESESRLGEQEIVGA